MRLNSQQQHRQHKHGLGGQGGHGGRGLHFIFVKTELLQTVTSFPHEFNITAALFAINLSRITVPLSFFIRRCLLHNIYMHAKM